MEKLICPLRPSGGPCVGTECAWYHEDECSVVSTARSLYSLAEDIHVLLQPPTITKDTMDVVTHMDNIGPGKTITIGGKIWNHEKSFPPEDEDVPF